MSAFDRLQGYSSKRGLNETSEVFDVTTPAGAFLNRVHNEGYKMYEYRYHLKPEFQLPEGDVVNLMTDEEAEAYEKSLNISEAEYEKVENKEQYERVTEFTETHDAITTAGNQIINAVAGSGKALKNGTPVLTADGYELIENLKVGDFVYGTDGKHHEVLGVFPQGKKKLYEVVSTDGVAVPCSPDHLWTLYNKDFSACKTMTTEEIDKELMENEECEFYLFPKVTPVELEDTHYNFSDERGANIKSDLENFIEFGVVPCDLLFACVKDRIKACDLILNAITGDLNYESFMASKEVLWYKVEIPSLLLVGMNTVDGVIFFFNSLGIGCKLEFDGETYNIYLFPPQLRGIQSIIAYKDEADMTCITIDAEDHLYLTMGMLPTHNTTALTFKIMYDIVTGEAMTLKQIESGLPVRVVNKMWVCTFLRSGAEELQVSLTKWQRKLGYSQTADQINFSTMDAEFKRCINAMGVATNIGDAGKLHSLFCKAVDSCNVSRSGGYPLTKEDYQILSGILVYYRGRLDNQRYNHPSMKDYDLTPTILDLIAKQFANLRATNGIMDFEEIMELLYKYLYVEPNPAVQDFVANRYNYIYIDEFQDTSQMAYAILKFYARGKLWLNRFGGDVKVVSEGGTVADGLYTAKETIGKIVVVGDPSQCIYSFRGSDSKILVHDFDEDFKPCLSRLSVNWRCPANILNPVVSSIHCNPDSAIQDIRAAREGGEFFAYAFPSYKSMIAQLKVDITKDMEDDMRVAVLCRTNFDGLIPAFVLAEDGRFDFSISGENMTLSSPLPRKIIGVTSLFTERSTPAVKTTLEFFASRQDKWGVKQLIDTLKMNNMSIWQIPIEDIRYSCPSLEKFVTSVKKVFYTDGSRDKAKELEALRTVYYMMIVDVFAGDSAYCESARAYIETLLYVIENNDFQSVYEFLEEIELLNDKLSGRIKKKSAPIQIATVHEYKGKECDSVYVWNDSDGTFPSSKCDVNNEDQLNEERRVHYIACTRAKKREHIYSIQIKKGRFAKEMSCDWYNPVNPSAKLQKTSNDLIL